MKETAVLLALFFGCAAPACAEDALPPKTHPDVSDWEDLFASDLSNTITQEGVWSFKDGVLSPTKDVFLWTRKEYDNFILDLEFKTAPGTNSGVVVHCSDMDNWISGLVEIQIADDYAEKWANSPKSWQCGAIFGHLPAKKSNVKRPGEWNRYTITCKDTMVYVMLNGELVTEMDTSKWTSGTKNPDGTHIPEFLGTKPLAEMPTKGRIGLQGKHAGAPIFFRNIKIKEL